MQRYKMIVRVDAADGCDDEFNRWYDDEHMAHVLATPGFTSFQRYRVVHSHGAKRSGYCTVFDIVTDDISGVIAELGQRASDGRMPMSSSMNPAVEFEIIEAVVGGGPPPATQQPVKAAKAKEAHETR